MTQLMDMIKQEDNFIVRYLDKNNLSLKKKLKNIKNKKKNNLNIKEEEEEETEN